MIKVLVVDDSALVRKLLGRALSEQSDFEVAFARDGREALERNRAFEPDVITLDVQMPELDGLGCLDRIMIERPCPVVMVSSLTAPSAEASLEALRLGAVDVMAKPGGAVSLQMDVFGPQFVAKVRAAARARLRPSLRLKERVKARTARIKRSPTSAPAPRANKALTAATGEGLVLIGCSTGGPPALEAVLTALPHAFPWPIVIAQHIPAAFTDALARRLDRLCAIAVRELAAPCRLDPGVAYIGRGDSDIVVEAKGAGLMGSAVASQTDYLWHPSVDRLVRSALEALPAEQLIGVLMTGMGNDGASAMALLSARGGRTIAESEETAVVWGMPGELVRASGADWVLPLPEIGACLQKLAP
jgi:two-component system chemotaxis response regulator CheB